MSEPQGAQGDSPLVHSEVYRINLRRPSRQNRVSPTR